MLFRSSGNAFNIATIKASISTLIVRPRLRGLSATLAPAAQLVSDTGYHGQVGGRASWCQTPLRAGARSGCVRERWPTPWFRNLIRGLNQVEEFQAPWRSRANSRTWLKSEPGSELRRHSGTLAQAVAHASRSSERRKSCFGSPPGRALEEKGGTDPS